MKEYNGLEIPVGVSLTHDKGKPVVFAYVGGKGRLGMRAKRFNPRVCGGMERALKQAIRWRKQALREHTAAVAALGEPEPVKPAAARPRKVAVVQKPAVVAARPVRKVAAVRKPVAVPPRKVAAVRKPTAVAPRKVAAVRKPVATAPRKVVTTRKPVAVTPRKVAAVRKPTAVTPRKVATARKPVAVPARSRRKPAVTRRSR